MSQRCPLIAKITPPSMCGFYPRERLFRLLDDHRGKLVTWVSGPAGSGKTALVTSYLRSKDLPCLWYRIDAGDADVATFFYYMGLAAQKVEAEDLPPLPLLTSEYQMCVPIFARRFFEALYCRLESPFVMVLDDYQEAPLDSPFQEIIHTGLSYLPEGIRVIVLSRNEPPPSLIRLRAGMIYSIGWNDIRLTEEESRNAVRMKDDRILNPETHSLLYQKTQGWAVGLELFIECSRSRNIDYRLLDRLTPEEIFDFFAIEIFRKANYETRAFLLRTSFLPTMTVQMAEKLTCIKLAGRILSDLEKTHCFIEKRVQNAPVYSYHPLFREFLSAKAMEILEADEIAEIRQDAARLLIDEQLVEEAATLLLDGENWDRFVPFVLSQAPTFLVQGRRATLATWLDAIPPKIADETPWLLYWQGVCSLGLVNARSRELFDRSFRLFQALEDNAGSLLAWSGVVNSIFFDFDDFRLLDPWIDWLDRKLKQGIVFPSAEIKLSVFTSMIIALIHRMPAHPRLKNWVEETLPLSLQGMSIAGCTPTYPFFIFYYLSRGDFDDCAVIVNEIRSIVRFQGASPLQNITLKLIEALMCTTAAQSHEGGVKAVTAGLELARETGARLFDPLLLGVGVQNALNARDMPLAATFLNKMENGLKYSSRGHAGYFFYLSAWYQLCAGSPSRAVVLGEKCMSITEEIGLVFPEADCRVLLALASLETGDLKSFRQHLDALGILVAQSHSTFLEYRYHLLNAHFAFERRAQKSALAHLTKAMTMGRQKGFMTMVNFWNPDILCDLCAKALEAGIEVEHVRCLVHNLDLKPNAFARQIEHWPWPVQIFTLGRFEIIKNGKRLDFPTKTPHKLLALLKALISCGPKGASEEQLADMMWPDSDGDTALKSLEISIHRLRRLLGGNKVLAVRQGRVGLAAEYCRVDAHSFEGLLDKADQVLFERQMHPHSQTAKDAEAWLSIERAVKIYRGPFLGGSSKSWVVSYSERLKYRYLHAVTRLGGYYEGQNRFEDASRWYGKGLKTDDGAEPFYRGMMRCYLAMGRSSEALTVYHRCKKVMLSVFGVPLSCEMEDLYRKLPP